MFFKRIAIYQSWKSDCEDLVEPECFSTSQNNRLTLVLWMLAFGHLVPIVHIHACKSRKHAKNCWFCPSCILVFHGGSEEVRADADNKEKEKHAQAAKLGLEHEAREQLRQAVDHDLSETLVNV